MESRHLVNETQITNLLAREAQQYKLKGKELIFLELAHKAIVLRVKRVFDKCQRKPIQEIAQDVLSQASTDASQQRKHGRRAGFTEEQTQLLKAAFKAEVASCRILIGTVKRKVNTGERLARIKEEYILSKPYDRR